MSVIDMGIGNDMHQLTHLHITGSCKHMQKHSILNHIPVIGSKYILRPLIENTVQGKLILTLLLCYIEGHAVSAGVEIHLR